MLFAAVTTNWGAVSWNDQSRMATVQGLVEHHTLAIDQSRFIETGDKVFIRGHFYSDKPPLPSIIGALVYFPLYHLGLRLDLGNNTAYFLTTLCTIKLFYLLGLAAFCKALEFTGTNRDVRILLTAALGVGSLYLSWSSVFNNHALAASFLIIGFFFLLKAKFTDSKKLPLFLSALFLASAGVADIPMSIFYAGFFLLVLFNKKLRGDAVFFLIPAVLVYLPYLLINYHISGSIMPVQMNKAFFNYPGSQWIDGEGLSGVKANSLDFILHYTVALLFGNRGFVIYNPLLIMAAYYLVAHRDERFDHEALTIGACSLIVLGYYAVMTKHQSGCSYSIRWFVPLIPLLYFFLYPVFTKGKKVSLIFFSVLLSGSIAVAAVGVINPWSDLSISEKPFITNLVELAWTVSRSCW